MNSPETSDQGGVAATGVAATTAAASNAPLSGEGENNGGAHEEEAQEEQAQRTHSFSLIIGAIKILQQMIFPLVAAFLAMDGKSAIMGGFAGIAALCITIAFVLAYWAWRRRSYTIGTQDIKLESGILARKARSLPFSRVQDVSLEQALLPRLLGLAEVKFESGAGAGDDISLRYLRMDQGEQLRDLIRYKLQDPAAQTAAQSVAQSAPDVAAISASQSANAPPRPSPISSPENLAVENIGTRAKSAPDGASASVSYSVENSPENGSQNNPQNSPENSPENSGVENTEQSRADHIAGAAADARGPEEGATTSGVAISGVASSGAAISGANTSGILQARTRSQVLFAMDGRRLICFGLFEFSLAIFAVIFGLVQSFDGFGGFAFFDPDYWITQFSGTGEWVAGWAPVAQFFGAIWGLAGVILVGVISGVITTILRDWGFSLERTQTGFRRRRGLLSKSDVVMPARRVQALKLSSGFLRRFFGWHGLKFMSLASDSQSSSHDVAPFARADEFEPIMRSAGFEPADDALNWRRRSGKYTCDTALIFGGAMAVISGLVGYFAPIPWVWSLPLFAGFLLVLDRMIAQKVSRNALSDTQIFSTRGWFAPRMTIATREKLQSIAIVQGPLGRLRGYAALHLGLAGGRFVIEGLPLERAEILRAALLHSMARRDYAQLA